MIEKVVRYKVQGSGNDSWEISEYFIDIEHNSGHLITRYMVYEDPSVKPIPNVDIIGLLNSLTEEELNQIKQIINNP